MAIFGAKKNTEKTEKTEKVVKTPKVSKKAEKKPATEVAVVEADKKVSNRDLSGVIRRPRITEKASFKAEQGVYAFDVDVNANKRTIAAAVKEQYNVTPIKIAVITIPQKQVVIRNRKGVKGGGKKAYVYLKKGETIEFV
jgi:large subunit ribosomal protein L23